MVPLVRRCVNGLPRVSVVVVNYRSYDVLRRCLESLLRSDYPDFEVVVVDSLTQGLEKKIREDFKDRAIKVVHFDSNIGASASHNIGAVASDPESKYLIFMDNDVFVTPEAIRFLVETMEKEPRIGILQAKVVSKSNRGKMDHMGLGLDIAGTWVTTYGQEAGAYDEPLEIFAASSAFMITRRELYFQALGFDDTYFIYDDDTDYSWRVRLQGYTVAYEPRAIVYHEDKFENRLRYDKLYFGFRNRLLNIIKNLEAENMATSLVSTLYLAYLNVLMLSLSLRGREAYAYLKATANVISNLPRRLVHRKIVQIKRLVSDKFLYKKGFLRRDLLGTIIMLRALLTRYFTEKSK